MTPNLPNWINLFFILITVITILFFYLSNGKPKKALIIILSWSIVQSILAYIGFYEDMSLIPPRFLLVLLPPLLLIIYTLVKNKKQILADRNIKISTFLHVIRIPVEITLYYLFVYKAIPELMTFEGRNFDILAGITAPIIGFLYLKNKIGRKGLLIWNVVCLGMILFILVNGLLSTELPFQQFGFEQPNKAVLYFPFILLPAVVVPIVIYTHIIDIMKLIK